MFSFGFPSAALAAEPRWLEPVAVSNLPAGRVTGIGLGYDRNGNATAAPDFLKSGSGRNRAELPASVFSLPGARRYRVVLRASDEYGNLASSTAPVTLRPSAPAR